MSPKHQDQIRALKEKATQALSDAELLLEHGSVEAAVNRGYYAVFQAARAALLTKDDRPKTHAGVIQRFGYHFVRTEQVSEKTSDILSTAQSMRGQADYEAFSHLTEEDAAHLAEDARRFIEAIEKHVLSRR
jgi:uncharacterized protein (UPF0332 family)